MDKIGKDFPLDAEEINNISSEEGRVIPIAEEQITIGKKLVDIGKVKIVKSIKEEDVKVDLPYTNEEIDIERISKNQYIESPPPVRYEGDTTIVPVYKEVVVVEKRLMLTEEIRITKKRKEGTTQQIVKVRKQVVNVEHIPNRSVDDQI